MAIIFYCYRCGKKGEFETKKDMKCDCGHYIKERGKASDHVNMRNTLSGTTKMEFSGTTVEDSIKEMNE